MMNKYFQRIVFIRIMMYTPNEILFPPHAIPVLEDARGESWQSLVERMDALPDHHEEKLAFVLCMIRLNGCLSCETDSFRAMKGCSSCALQTLRRFKGNDDDLLQRYQKALAETQQFLAQERDRAK